MVADVGGGHLCIGKAVLPPRTWKIDALKTDATKVSNLAVSFASFFHKLLCPLCEAVFNVSLSTTDGGASGVLLVGVDWVKESKNPV